MLETDVIYRVIYSPTQHEYAYSRDGVSVETHHSLKRARQAHGDLPLEIISHAEFKALSDV